MARFLFSESAPYKSEARGLYQQYSPLETDPRRKLFQFARACAIRRWAWLRERIPVHDWDQTVSLAICTMPAPAKSPIPNAEAREIARRVDNEFYSLARAESYCRPSRGLLRGNGCGKWIAIEREIEARLTEKHIENQSPEGLYNTIIDRRITC